MVDVVGSSGAAEVELPVGGSADELAHFNGGSDASETASVLLGSETQRVDVFAPVVEGVEGWVRSQIATHGDGSLDLKSEALHWLDVSRLSGRMDRLTAIAISNVVRSAKGDVVAAIVDVLNDMDENPHEYIGFGD